MSLHAAIAFAAVAFAFGYLANEPRRLHIQSQILLTDANEPCPMVTFDGYAFYPGACRYEEQATLCSAEIGDPVMSGAWWLGKDGKCLAADNPALRK